jgi:hypothetical protein
VLAVLACWPPGPPLAENRHRSSDSGIVQLPVTRRMSEESTRGTVPTAARAAR